MKIIKNTVATLVVLLAAYVATGMLFKFEMYDAAMKFEASLSGLEKKQARISIGDIEYYEHGSVGEKPTVLLVHGFAAYKENWLRFARSFKNDFHVLIVDLPGHGNSVKSPELTYSFANQVKWLNELMAVLGVKAFHMAGNSMGGAITALYSAQYPQQVLTATLIDPAGLRDHTPILKEYLDRGENPLIVNSTEDFEALMDFALEQKPFIPWPITEVSAYRASSLKPIHDKLWLDFQDEQGEGFKSVLQRIQAPTLILWGKQDKVINYKNAEVFAQHIGNAKMHIWDNVGHAPMVEIPKESAAKMLMQISAM